MEWHRPGRGRQWGPHLAGPQGAGSEGAGSEGAGSEGAGREGGHAVGPDGERSRGAETSHAVGPDGSGAGRRGAGRGIGRGKGFRWTAARRLVLDVLRSDSGYISAEDVYLRVHERDEDIAMATVYRTLHVLAQMGLAHRIDTAEGRARFRHAGDGEPKRQGVLVCRNCGDSEPVDLPASPAVEGAVDQAVAAVTDALRAERGFRVEHTVLQFYGWCRRCGETRAPVEQSG